MFSFLAFHVLRCSRDVGIKNRSSCKMKRAEWMLTIEGLISVLGLCLTCFGLGYAIGSKDNNKPQK